MRFPGQDTYRTGSFAAPRSLDTRRGLRCVQGFLRDLPEKRVHIGKYPDQHGKSNLVSFLTLPEDMYQVFSRQMRVATARTVDW